jgi:hypothetical protein
MAVLTLAILCVGIVFQTSSAAVGTSEALLEQMESARAIDFQLRRDVAGIDKRAFLIIRSRLLDPHNANSPRFDQLAFLAYGSFSSRTGTFDPARPYTATTANAAHIWWGQLLMQQLNAPDASYAGYPFSRDPRQNSMPTGVLWNQNHWVHKEEECVLGRSATLLLPGKTVQPNEGIAATDGASSRHDVANIMPWQIIDQVNAARDLDSLARYCYRFQALSSVYDSQDPQNPFLDGCFQMHPIVLRGVSSLKIDWTDGTTDDKGELAWFGPTNFQGSAIDDQLSNFYSLDNEGIEWVFNDPDKYGQNYMAVFVGNRPGTWPTALRITYHVVNSEHRLQGGRDFVVVATLPD